MRLLATITLLRLLKGADVVYFTLSNPSVDTSYTFVLTNGTAGSADYTTTDVIVTVRWSNYWNGIADTIDEVDETFSIANGTVSATQLSTTMHLLWQRSPASATEGSDVVFDFTLSNPSAVDTSYTLF
jgi:hypothetical protein